MNADTLRAAIVASLAPLAAAREYAVSTVEIPPARPLSDFCPTCGGSARDWPMRVPGGARCASDWHNEYTA